MNYSELVTSKTPSVYVNFNDGNFMPEIGDTSSTYLTHLNPFYSTTFRKFGHASQRIGASGSTQYDYTLYKDPSYGGYVGTVLNYWHQEFWVYYTATFTQNMHIGFFHYQNVSPSYTWTGVVGSSVLGATKQISFGTGHSGTGTHTMTSVNTVPIGQWVHIALQYDNGTKRIYINGVLDSEVTGITGGLPGYFSIPQGARVTTYYDECAFWASTSTTKPANYPTAADILERATFPSNKTRYWNATVQQWVDSSDERYWNGTEWIAMQQLPYKVWNGTDWVAV